MQASEMLTQAAALVDGSRKATYGDPADNFARCAALWNAYLAIRREPAAPLTPEDVCHLHALAKVARTQGPIAHPDNWIDGAAYIALAGEVSNG